MKQRTDYTCPLELTHDIIRGKWKPIILWQLNKGTSSLSSLEKSILGISRKMLIQHLTDRGRRIFEAVSILQSVGIELMLEDNRGDFLREKGLL